MIFIFWSWKSRGKSFLEKEWSSCYYHLASYHLWDWSLDFACM